MHDLIIRSGTIVDGTGAAPFVGDIAIDGERDHRGRQGHRNGDAHEIDAKG